MKALIPFALGLSLLAGCSGDDEPNKDAKSTESASPGSKANPTKAEERKCKVQVELTGAVQATWKGKGRAIVDPDSVPTAIYQADHKKFQLSAYAGDGEDFKSSVTLSTPRGSFSTPQEDNDGLDVQADGKAADVDVDAQGMKSDQGTHVTASFTC